MYFPSDKLYIESKSIKLAHTQIKKEFAELAIWAKQKLNVTILNAFFSLKNNNTLPSLHIVFELQKDYNQLHGDSEKPYNQKFNLLVASKYLEILKTLKIDDSGKYEAKEFHMSYSVFSQVAIIECLNELNKSNLSRIKEKYASNGLWEISIHHGSIVVFYAKETDIESNEKSGINKQIQDEIIIRASRYDEFKYLEKESFFFGFDSKEIFDTKYGGDWYNYYR